MQYLHATSANVNSQSAKYDTLKIEIAVKNASGIVFLWSVNQQFVYICMYI